MRYRDLFKTESAFLESTVEAARDWFRNKIIDKGGVCPVCDKFGKIYKTRLYGNIGYTLIWLYKRTQLGRFVHVPSKANRRVLKLNKVGLLATIGLAEKGPKRGYYRITQLGKDFVEEKVKVRKYVYLYNDDVITFSGMDTTEVTIRQVMADSEGFDFDEIMASNME